MPVPGHLFGSGAETDVSGEGGPGCFPVRIGHDPREPALLGPGPPSPRTSPSARRSSDRAPRERSRRSPSRPLPPSLPRRSEGRPPRRRRARSSGARRRGRCRSRAPPRHSGEHHTLEVRGQVLDERLAVVLERLERRAHRVHRLSSGRGVVELEPHACAARLARHAPPAREPLDEEQPEAALVVTSIAPGCGTKPLPASVTCTHRNSSLGVTATCTSPPLGVPWRIAFVTISVSTSRNACQLRSRQSAPARTRRIVRGARPPSVAWRPPSTLARLLLARLHAANASRAARLGYPRLPPATGPVATPTEGLPVHLRRRCRRRGRARLPRLRPPSAQAADFYEPPVPAARQEARRPHPHAEAHGLRRARRSHEHTRALPLHAAHAAAGRRLRHRVRPEGPRAEGRLAGDHVRARKHGHRRSTARPPRTRRPTRPICTTPMSIRCSSAGSRPATRWCAPITKDSEPRAHPYLVGASEGRSVLDMVRAARQVNKALSKRVIIAGHSQGGHAALWAASLAPSYTKELDVRGTVAYAPASHLSEQGGISVSPHDQGRDQRSRRVDHARPGGVRTSAPTWRAC